MRLFAQLAIAIALLATILSSLSVYPHQLAYFCEVAGGSCNGSAHLLHSNVDWGQDLLYLKDWADGKKPKTLYVAFYGAMAPKDVGMSTARVVPDIWRSDSTRLTEPAHTIPTGWYAISVQVLNSQATQSPIPRDMQTNYLASVAETFSAFTPLRSLGRSIRLFHIRPSTNDNITRAGSVKPPSNENARECHFVHLPWGYGTPPRNAHACQTLAFLYLCHIMNAL